MSDAQSTPPKDPKGNDDLDTDSLRKKAEDPEEECEPSTATPEPAQDVTPM